MIVNWKKKDAGLKVIPLVNEAGKIERNLVFLPGYNEISEADWNKARRHPTIAEQLKKGDFEEIGKVKIEEVSVVKEVVKEVDGKEKKVKETKTEKVEKIEEQPLKDIEAAKALDIIKDTFALDTLEAWRKAESRDEIRAAIANQIEKVSKGTK